MALPSAWRPGTKLRTPLDHAAAGVRTLDPPAEQRTNMAVGVVGGLGQPLRAAPAPNGWPDRAADRAAPEAMLRRVHRANGFAARVGTTETLEIANTALGPLLRPATRHAVRRATQLAVACHPWWAFPIPANGRRRVAPVRARPRPGR